MRGDSLGRKGRRCSNLGRPFTLWVSWCRLAKRPWKPRLNKKNNYPIWNCHGHVRWPILLFCSTRCGIVIKKGPTLCCPLTERIIDYWQRKLKGKKKERIYICLFFFLNSLNSSKNPSHSRPQTPRLEVRIPHVRSGAQLLDDVQFTTQ